MSSGELSSSGLWLTPPFRLRTKSIPDGTPALARMPASWPAPEGSSRTGSAERLQLRAQRGPHLVRHRAPAPSASAPRSRARRRGGRAARRPARARRPRGRRGPGITFVPPGSTVTWPTVATAPFDPARDLARPQHELGGLDERVLAARHRRRARVARRAGERSAAAHVADDPGDDAERRVRAQERRPLLDVQLDVGVRAARRSRAAAGAAALLVAEDDDAEPGEAEPLDRLEPGDDAERAVEAAAAGNRVEMRARPDLRARRPGSGRSGCRPRRPPPRARPRGTSRPRARAPRPPRASSRSGRRSRPAPRVARGPAPGDRTAGGPAAEPQRAHGARNGRSSHRRRAGRAAASPNASAPRGRRDRRREGDRRGDADAESTVCWKPIAAPLRRPPSSAAIVNERPFQAIESAVGDDERGDEQPAAARPRQTATTASAAPIAIPIQRSGRRARRARPTSGRRRSAARPRAPARRRTPPRPRRSRSRARRGGRGRRTPSSPPARRGRGRCPSRRARAAGRASVISTSAASRCSSVPGGARARRRARPTRTKPADEQEARPRRLEQRQHERRDRARRPARPSAGSPSARPRSAAANQRITARPLPDWTLPPATPASPSRTHEPREARRVRGRREERRADRRGPPRASSARRSGRPRSPRAGART